MICTTYFLTFFSELIPPTGKETNKEARDFFNYTKPAGNYTKSFPKPFGYKNEVISYNNTRIRQYFSVYLLLMRISS